MSIYGRFNLRCVSFVRAGLYAPPPCSPTFVSRGRGRYAFVQTNPLPSILTFSISILLWRTGYCSFIPTYLPYDPHPLRHPAPSVTPQSPFYTNSLRDATRSPASSVPSFFHLRRPSFPLSSHRGPQKRSVWTTKINTPSANTFPSTFAWAAARARAHARVRRSLRSVQTGLKVTLYARRAGGGSFI